MALFVIILSRLVPLLFVASITLIGSRYTFDAVSRTRPRAAPWAFAGVSLIGILACIPFAWRAVLLAGGRLALQEQRYAAADILLSDYEAWGGRLMTQMNRTWAFARMQLGDWHGAEEVLLGAPEPADPQTRLLLAVCAYYENNPAAESMLQQIPDVKGAQLQIREYLLGRIAQKRGRFSEAYLHYRRSAAAAPQFLPATYHGVRLNLLVGDPAVAQSILDSYVARFTGAALEPDVQTLRAAIARHQVPPDKEYQIVSH